MEEGGAMLEEVKEELDAVESVFAEELQDVVREPSQWLRISVRPDTAGEELQVFCSLVLKIDLPAGYPRQIAAAVELESVVGLNEQDTAELQQSLHSVAQEMQGDECPALFNLIQTAKDFVNGRNIPSDDCCICLCPFDGEDEFFKTPCAHCFHAECLARWTHDQAVQMQAKQSREAPRISLLNLSRCGQPRVARKEEKEGGEPHCPICRGPLGSDLVASLRKWTEPLAEAHARESARKEEEEAREHKLKQKESAARAWEERRRKEEGEREAFQPQPVLIIDFFAGDKKILKHVMAPLGAADCRVVGTGSKPGAKAGGAGPSMGVVWFAGMDKALRAHRSLEKSYAVRFATYDDLKLVP